MLSLAAKARPVGRFRIAHTADRAASLQTVRYYRLCTCGGGGGGRRRRRRRRTDGIAGILFQLPSKRLAARTVML